METLWRWREREAANAIGRGRELARLHDLVGGGAALVTITGTAGVGKTTLAAGFTRTLRGREEREAPRLAVCELALARDPAGLRRALGQALGVTVGGDDAGRDLSDLSRALSAGATLLVLDNFEQLLPAGSDVIRRILGDAPELQILVTSRERLDLSLEQVVELGPLGLPSPGDDPSRSEAFALLLRRIRALDPGYEPKVGEVDTLAELLQQLDGLPLAIELAAARCQVLSPGELLERLAPTTRSAGTPERLDGRFALLRRPGRQEPTARTDLRVSLDASWELLEPWERSALAQLSVFRGSASMVAVEEVVELSAHPSAPDVLDVVEALCRKSLVQAVAPEGRPGDRRFTVLLSIRDYAQEQLDALGERAAAEARHSECLAAAAEGFAGAGAAGLRALAVDLEDLVAAADHWIDRARREPADLESALALLIHIAPAARLSASYPEHIRRFDALLSLADGGEVDGALAARARLLRGHFALRLGRLEEALEDVQAAGALATRAGADEVAGLALATAATCHYRMGRMEEALADATGALEAGGRLGSAEVLALAREELGVVWWYLGRHEEARESLSEALDANRRRDDTLALLSVLIDLALVRIDLGDLDGARRAAEEGLALHEELGLPPGSMALPLLFALARVDHAAGHLDLAISRYRQVHERAHAASDEMFRTYTPAFVALVRFEQGAVVEAADRLREALASIDRQGEGPVRAFLRTALAAVEARRGALDEARGLLAQGLAELSPLRGSPLEVAGQLCAGIVEVAEAARETEPDTAEALSARAAARLAELAPLAAGDGPGSRPFELGLAARWLEAALARPDAGPQTSGGAVLLIEADGRWFEPAGAPRVACSRRPVMRRMLLALARAHREAPGRAIPADELVSSTWPGERMMAESARLRLHVMVSRLRDLGLREMLETTDEGYRLAPGLTVHLRSEM